jgi:hypothetical protein
VISLGLVPPVPEILLQSSVTEWFTAYAAGPFALSPGSAAARF